MVFGIDFSGAKDARNKIWIAKGVPEDCRLLVSECLKARDLPNSGSRHEACLPSLVNLINSNRNAAFGFDFPFGLPLSLVREETWEAFILDFPNRFNNPENFKRMCFSEAGDQELRRRTDDAAHTPLSPYNLRLYKQTYYGISKILLPLVRDAIACILPFQKCNAPKPWILEICPVSTLRSLDLNGISYKGATEIHRQNRRKILNVIEGKSPVAIKSADIRHRIIEDNGGDALDSVIAAMAIFNAIQDEDGLIPDDNGFWKIEGYVYV